MTMNNLQNWKDLLLPGARENHIILIQKVCDCYIRVLYVIVVSPESAHPVEASVNDDEVAHSNGQGPSSVPADDQAVKEPEQSTSPPLPPMNML